MCCLVAVGRYGGIFRPVWWMVSSHVGVRIRPVIAVLGSSVVLLAPRRLCLDRRVVQRSPSPWEHWLPQPARIRTLPARARSVIKQPPVWETGSSPTCPSTVKAPITLSSHFRRLRTTPPNPDHHSRIRSAVVTSSAPRPPGRALKTIVR